MNNCMFCNGPLDSAFACPRCNQVTIRSTAALPGVVAVPCSAWVAELEADLAKYIARKAEATNGTEMHGYWWGARDTAELILARVKERSRSATARMSEGERKTPHAS